MRRPLTPEIKNSLTSFASSHNMSLREMAQYINSMLERETILTQHKSPISQNENDKRWRTRLPNGKQLAKTRLEDLEDAIIGYYANLPKDSNSIIPQDDYTEPKASRHAVKSTAKVMETRTLKILYPEWMEVRQYEASANSAAINERMWQNYIENSDIADIPLAELTRTELKKWACKLITTHAMKKKYFDGIRDVINLLLDYAVDEKYIDINCFKGVRINKNLYQSATLKEENEEVFTEQEQKLVMQAAESDSKQKRSALPLGICILFLTGMRISELCGLRYGDIQGNYVHINRMVVENKKKTPEGLKFDGYKIVEHTKSSAGLRKIYLTEEARAYFEQIKELNKRNGYSTTSKDLVFQREKGMCNQRVFDTRLRKYCNPNHLDLPYAKSCHDIRRTFISHLFDLGLNPEKIRRIAGHQNIEMSMRYCRNLAEQDEIELILEQGLSCSKGV